LPGWLRAVVPTFEEAFKIKGAYPSLGSLREAVKVELKKQRKAIPDNRTIERGLNTHRPDWFTNRGA
jgi:hypothetical protein